MRNLIGLKKHISFFGISTWEFSLLSGPGRCQLAKWVGGGCCDNGSDCMCSQISTAVLSSYTTGNVPCGITVRVVFSKRSKRS